jgi:hypothetical protein
MVFHPVADLTALDVAETLQQAQVGITRLLDRYVPGQPLEPGSHGYSQTPVPSRWSPQ